MPSSVLIPHVAPSHINTPTKIWLDLGNTRLKYWIIDDNDQLLLHDAKEHLKAPNELLIGLLGLFVSYQPIFIGISSVLGQTLNQKIAHTLDSLAVYYEFACVQQQHKLLNTLYHADQLGVDRWLQMLGAVCDDKICVVGCGTALTIDLVDVTVHLGGYIFPNVYLQRQALYAGTQQIEVNTGSFHSTDLGKNTTDAVNRGILLSVVGAVNEVMHRHRQYRLVLTGGGAVNLAKQLSLPLVIEPNLLLNGLKRYMGGGSQ